jgi:hypothetical protein
MDTTSSSPPPKGLDIETINKIKQQRRNRPLSPEDLKRLSKQQESFSRYKDRKKIYKTDLDYYEDIFFDTKFCGLIKTYHSDYMFTKQINKRDIPRHILKFIRHYEDFYIDKMNEIIDTK